MHGLHGEVELVPVSNRPERFQQGVVLYTNAGISLQIIASRSHKNRWLVRFADVADRTAAEKLRGEILYGEPLGPLPEGEFWVHELIGMRVEDAKYGVLGTVVEVEQNPAHDLLVLDTGHLIPMPFVEKTANSVIHVQTPDGLLDL